MMLIDIEKLESMCDDAAALGCEAEDSFNLLGIAKQYIKMRNDAVKHRLGGQVADAIAIEASCDRILASLWGEDFESASTYAFQNNH